MDKEKNGWKIRHIPTKANREALCTRLGTLDAAYM